MAASLGLNAFLGPLYLFNCSSGELCNYEAFFQPQFTCNKTVRANLSFCPFFLLTYLLSVSFTVCLLFISLWLSVDSLSYFLSLCFSLDSEQKQGIITVVQSDSNIILSPWNHYELFVLKLSVGRYIITVVQRYSNIIL